jgi:hypothetical protein
MGRKKLYLTPEEAAVAQRKSALAWYYRNRKKVLKHLKEQRKLQKKLLAQ